MAHFTWLNHAAFAVDDADMRLVCDPWLTGTAFNRGWRLISPSAFTPDDFRSVTHIWFSHQHPDHFSPADLRAIAPEVRRGITVLYHETIDKKVVRFCKGLGFKDAVELRNDTWHQLTPRVRVLCNGWSDRDSWIAIETPDATILNINDCVVDTPALATAIAQRVPNPDVLMTQFSYANWAGNPESIDYRRAQAAEKFTRIALQCAALQPRYVMPFASYVYFCHEENFFQNDGMNRVGDVARFIEDELHRIPVVLYPGQTWRIADAHDWRSASLQYDRDFDARIAEGPTDSRRVVDPSAIERAAAEFLKRIKKRNPLLPFLPNMSTTVELLDDRRRLRLSLDGIAETRDDADIVMAAESLLFALRTPWGSNALGVNGRYTEPRPGSAKRFFNLFRAADLNDHGKGFDMPWLTKTIGTRLRKSLPLTRS